MAQVNVLIFNAVEAAGIIEVIRLLLAHVVMVLVNVLLAQEKVVNTLLFIDNMGA